MTDAVAETLAKTKLSDRHVDDDDADALTVPAPSSLPTTLARSYAVHGIETDTWVELYADRTVVGASQIGGRVGNFVLCQAHKSPVDQRVEFTLINLLGAREDAMLGLYARRITQLLVPYHQHAEKLELMLAISLRQDTKDDPNMFATLVEVLVKLVVEAMQLKS